jgi:hypothetical protein
MKKNKLIIEYEFGFELIGITASLKGYKLAWEINNKLGVHLVKQPDLSVGFKKLVEKSFSYYAFETRLNRLKLFKNKPNEIDSGKYFLVPEYPHYDFIILFEMEEPDFRDNLITLMRQIPSVALVAPIPLESLKSKSNFVF